MEKINKKTVEKLIEFGPFSSLSEVHKSVVLKEMTAKEFDQIRQVILLKTPFISADKFNLEPNSDIQKNLLEKIKSKPTEKLYVKQLYIYGSSVAAILILLLLMYTYFFQEPSIPGNHSIAEAKDKIKPIESPKEPESKRIEPEENQQAFLTEIEKESVEKTEKRKVVISKSKEIEQTSPSEDLEEFRIHTTEDLAIEAEDDADLARFSDESERVFHYYTRMN